MNTQENLNNIELNITEIAGIKLSEIVNIPAHGSIIYKNGNRFYSIEGLENLMKIVGDKYRLPNEDDMYTLMKKGHIMRAGEFEKAGFELNGKVEKENGKAILTNKNVLGRFWIGKTPDHEFIQIRKGSSGYVNYKVSDNTIYCQVRLIEK